MKYSFKVEYIEPIDKTSDDENKVKLLKFITLFSQVGFREVSLNPNTNIRIDYFS